MQVETFPVGILYTNCYVANCQQTKEAIIIDPGLDFPQEANPIFSYIAKTQLTVKFIVNTHGHNDHIKGDILFQKRFEVPICIHPLDRHYLETIQSSNNTANMLMQEGDLLKFGVETLKVLHTPGHTPGSICLVGKNLVFTGDTLFAGSIGRTDLGGSMTDMQKSLKKITRLPDDLLVYAGHGENTLIRQEKMVNPFLTGEYSLF